MKYNNEISANLNDIKNYVDSALLYLKGTPLNKKEVIMYLSCVDEIIITIKNDLINYLYYLDDKIDAAYKKETERSITSFIASLYKEDYNE